MGSQNSFPGWFLLQVILVLLCKTKPKAVIQNNSFFQHLRAFLQPQNTVLSLGIIFRSSAFLALFSVPHYVLLALHVVLLNQKNVVSSSSCCWICYFVKHWLYLKYRSIFQRHLFSWNSKHTILWLSWT